MIGKEKESELKETKLNQKRKLEAYSLNQDLP
jgi:hypothetical protein